MSINDLRSKIILIYLSVCLSTCLEVKLNNENKKFYLSKKLLKKSAGFFKDVELNASFHF